MNAPAAGLLLTAALLAQMPEPKPAPPAETAAQQAIVNDGKPMRLPFACGQEEIEKLSLNCSADEPCEVFLELAAVEAQGDKLFAAGNLHTSNVTLFSVLLRSEDGGKTWTEAFERIPSAGIDQLQFLDLETGWAAGQVLGALPRDPFLLLTTDGGKSFFKHNVLAEPGLATIDHFWFDTRQMGTLLLDRTRGEELRWALYQTVTGGASWTLREASPKIIPTRRPKPAAPPTWRVRADGPSKSYRIERRDASRWSLVASFLVDAGECRPVERPLEPPKPVEEVPPEPVVPRRPPSLKKKQ